MTHVWKKQATNDTQKNVIIRSWSCRCGASKTRVSRGESAPRATAEVKVSQEKCTK